jgi:hypothetical protein
MFKVPARIFLYGKIDVSLVAPREKGILKMECEVS